MVTIAPNGRSATYTDATGDKVVVTTTRGTFLATQFTFDPSTPGQLTELSLTGSPAFNGAAINFTVYPVSGSTAVNVGYIDAIGLSLTSVTIPGDLGRIDVGGGGTLTALGTLTVNSLGVGNTTQGGLTPPGNLVYDTVSNIVGTVGTVNIAGNLDGTLFAQDYNANLPGTGNIFVLNVGGSIDGNVGYAIAGNSHLEYFGAGQVVFTGYLGTAVIGGGIEGGPLAYSGSIGGYTSTSSGGVGSFSKIGSITVKGSVPDDPNPNPTPGAAGTSIYGGSGAFSGGILADTIGVVNIAGDVTGGTGTASGFIEAPYYLQSVTIHGSLLGGNFTPGSPSQAAYAGFVSGGSIGIGSVVIGKNLYGGSGINSGQIYSPGTIQNVLVMGNIGGGTAGTSSTVGFAGAIHGNLLGTVTVMGSVIGGNAVIGDPNQAANGGGLIASDTSIGVVKIGGDVMGGSGANSGQITSGTSASVVVISGAHGLVGGAGAASGEISIGTSMTELLIKNNITGGSGAGAGLVQVTNNLGYVSIGGNLTGGTANDTGLFAVGGILSQGLINGNVQGGNNTSTTLLADTGYLQANAIGTLTVGEAIIAGYAGTGGLDTSGAIRSSTTIGTIVVGSLNGNPSNPAIISAVGPANVPFGAVSDVAIGTVVVKYGSTYGDILAGYSTNTTDANGNFVPTGVGVNANAQIGTVIIEGNLTASNIIAGVGAGTGGMFGNAGSTSLGGAGVTDLPTIVSRISEIVVTGYVVGPSTSTADTFGIAAQYIGVASIHGKTLPLVPGADNDTFANGAEQTLLSGGNGNTYLYEV